MTAYLARRALLALLTLAGVTLLTFAVVYGIPADPARLQAPPSASPEVVENIRKKLGLDQPLWVQYGRFLGRLVRGDLGVSHRGEPVGTIIARRLPATIQLALAGW